MEVIARIPRLHHVDREAVNPPPRVTALESSVADPGTASTQRQPSAASPGVSDAADAACAAPPLQAVGRAPAPRSVGGRRTATTLFSPSIFVLAAVAAAVWAAAWRNDRLRALEQRPQRVAMEPPVTAGPERSLTP